MKTEHILVIRFSAMGDVAMTVPVIYSLARHCLLYTSDAADDN